MGYDKEYINQMKCKFIKAFNRNWMELQKNLFFQQEQFSSGNRLRPYIICVGYLATKSDLELLDYEYENISRLALSIELIHKSSLILDDLIDDDPARHGKKAFHVEYGTEKTMMFAVNLLSISARNLNSLIAETPEYNVLKAKGMDLLIKTMYDMSLGELKELSLNNTSRYEREKIQEIIKLETSPLIANSLLLGYYAGNGNNNEVEDIFESIGNDCGYVFQVMNDLEPFCQQEKLKQHKGRLNTDIGKSKKNIVLTMLYGLLSLKEKETLEKAFTTDDINKLLIHYFNIYNLEISFMREVNLVHQNINEKIALLPNYNLNKDWCNLFTYFVGSIIDECKNRLS